MYGALE